MQSLCSTKGRSPASPPSSPTAPRRLGELPVDLRRVQQATHRACPEARVLKHITC
jgi:hypothetical protein